MLDGRLQSVEASMQSMFAMQPTHGDHGEQRTKRRAPHMDAPDSEAQCNKKVHHVPFANGGHVALADVADFVMDELNADVASIYSHTDMGSISERGSVNTNNLIQYIMASTESIANDPALMDTSIRMICTCRNSG